MAGEFTSCETQELLIARFAAQRRKSVYSERVRLWRDAHFLQFECLIP